MEPHCARGGKVVLVTGLVCIPDLPEEHRPTDPAVGLECWEERVPPGKGRPKGCIVEGVSSHQVQWLD